MSEGQIIAVGGPNTITNVEEEEKDGALRCNIISRDRYRELR